MTFDEWWELGNNNTTGAMKLAFSELWEVAAQSEREACAEICKMIGEDGGTFTPSEDNYIDGHMDACNECCWAIMDRSK